MQAPISNVCPLIPPSNKQNLMTHSPQLLALVQKQKLGARFVISAPMLGLDAIAFDKLAQTWIANGGPGFVLDGIPFRKVLDGQFFIQRVTVIRIAE
jgi:hypothetical protein